jgi:hypothetical protein
MRFHLLPYMQMPSHRQVVNYITYEPYNDGTPHPLVQTKLTELEENKKHETLAVAKSSMLAKASSTEERHALIQVPDSSSDSEGVPLLVG